MEVFNIRNSLKFFKVLSDIYVFFDKNKVKNIFYILGKYLVIRKVNL